MNEEKKPEICLSEKELRDFKETSEIFLKNRFAGSIRQWDEIDLVTPSKKREPAFVSAVTNMTPTSANFLIVKTK